MSRQYRRAALVSVDEGEFVARCVDGEMVTVEFRHVIKFNTSHPTPHRDPVHVTLVTRQRKIRLELTSDEMLEAMRAWGETHAAESAIALITADDLW